MEGFTILNASAGSGKTYQLTKSYLKLILRNTGTQQFRQILALTFTNKAVAEMKARILDSLYDFSHQNPENPHGPLFTELCEVLEVTTAELEKRASFALKLLLHNYSFFEVTTIDKFIHGIVRTFAKDLRISQHFEVALDARELLDAAIAQILRNAERNLLLQKVLIDFSLEKLDAQKSWNIVYDLREIGKLLFLENHHQHLKTLFSKGIADFENLKASLRDSIKASSNAIVAHATEVLRILEAHGLEFSDFKGQYFPKFMDALSKGLHTTDFKASWKQRFEELPLYNKSCPEGTKTLLDGLHPKFSQIFQSIKEESYLLSFLKNSYTNVLPLTVLNEIGKEIARIQKANNVLHISEFNKLISKEIQGQPAPYIYERLGERYRHYFIDEFQDTSLMQWQNLIPLIANALETETLDGQKGGLLLVGDVKQAIYRWRGGDPKQFLGLNEQTARPFTIAPDIQSLTTNWRSYSAIIDFNNKFFSFVAHTIPEFGYKNPYADLEQRHNHRKGGYIELAFEPKDSEDTRLFYCEAILGAIQRILLKGYSYDAVCILVRSNAQGSLLANYLTANNVPIISSEALLLMNNPEVTFLVALLEYMDNPRERLFQFNVLEYLLSDEVDRHTSIEKHLGHLDKFLSHRYGFHVQVQCTMPVQHILERAIFHFELGHRCGAHVFHLLDVALEVGQKSGVGITDFLMYWESKKTALAVASTESPYAVQIMTIHKSKGLEFPFVLFPFADTKINDPLKQKKLWVPFSGAEKAGFDEVLVTSSKDLEHCSEDVKEIWQLENTLSQLEDINVLYVALTRAVQGLFIFTKDTPRTTYGKLFKDYLSQEALWSERTTTFSFGDFLDNPLEKSEALEREPIPYIYTDNVLSNRWAVSSQMTWTEKQGGGAQWGTLLHEILSNIHASEDIGPALSGAVAQGTVPSENTTAVKEILQAILHHPLLATFYGKDVSGRNEAEIMDQQGNVYRPDRIVFTVDQEVSLLDYKTGKRDPDHEQQLNTYATLLQELGYVVAHKILVYIGDTINPVFI